VYAAGWIKRGPSGVIGSNKSCAEETVQALLDDYLHGRLAEPAQDAPALLELIRTRQPRAMDFADWQAIDRHERALGRAQRRPRVKLVDGKAISEARLS
jgi:ferredoxin--NADP+ reductase